MNRSVRQTRTVKIRLEDSVHGVMAVRLVKTVIPIGLVVSYHNDHSNLRKLVVHRSFARSLCLIMHIINQLWASASGSRYLRLDRVLHVCVTNLKDMIDYITIRRSHSAKDSVAVFEPKPENTLDPEYKYMLRVRL
jgi:hypothetical protein